MISMWEWMGQSYDQHITRTSTMKRKKKNQYEIWIFNCISNKCELWLIVKLSLATQFQSLNFDPGRYEGFCRVNGSKKQP